MARSQTVFSELTVAMAISGKSLDSIGNISEKAKSLFFAEEAKRKSQKSISGLELSRSGTRIRQWLQSEKQIKNPHVVWTGMEKQNDGSPVAQDLIIADTQIRISVKEDAHLFQNPSPVKVFQKWPSGDFQPSRDADWFLKIAPTELNNYYSACGGFKITGFVSTEDYYLNSSQESRKPFSKYVAFLHKDKNESVMNAYKKLCHKVSQDSANTFNENISKTFMEEKGTDAFSKAISPLFSTFFKIDSIEYILCGTENKTAFAILVDTLENWMNDFAVLDIKATALESGQPEVLITFTFLKKSNFQRFNYNVKSEIRWSHGKFCGNPESKLYRDSSWSYNTLAWAESI